MINNSIIQMVMNSKNPQQMVINMLQQSGNNPIINNVLQMVNTHNEQGIEQIARNLCASKGINPDSIIHTSR